MCKNMRVTKYVWPWDCDVIAHVIRKWGILQVALKVYYFSFMKDFLLSSCRLFNTVFEKGHY